MIHRDLKADNCLVGGAWPDGCIVKVADFGTLLKHKATPRAPPPSRKPSRLKHGIEPTRQVSEEASALTLTATLGTGTPLW